MSILLLDNHDSFTWNIVELLRSIGKDNPKIVTPENFRTARLEDFDRVIFSPGPGLPEEQPAMYEILRTIEKLCGEEGRLIPVLGVCLGMQAIAQYFGGKLYNLNRVIHGQPRKLKIVRPGHPLFRSIPDGSPIGLYHSWAVDPENLPGCLEILALSDDGVIMSLAHKTLPICGVQFHPESIMTPAGKQLLANWLSV